MEQIQLEKISNLSECSQLQSLSKEEVIQRYSLLADELLRLIKENYELRNQQISHEQIQLIAQEQLASLRNTLYGSSSERYKKPQKEKNSDLPPTPAQPRVRKPSERYPHLPVREQVISINPLPSCLCCGETMKDSGMTEDSEQLTVIPKRYEIVLQKRVKYRCSCQSSLLTSPPPARIIEGSSYSDEMIQDVALSKYCDLIPMERYSAMAARGGVKDLPPHSLIELTHSFADFVAPVYSLMKDEVLSARILQADETPHKMLEGSDQKSWYLWGFSTPEVCFLNCRNTRSGDIASDFLKNSKCEILLSDVYCGYKKAIRMVNQTRVQENQPMILCAYCNAHARRYFFKAFPDYKEAQFYLDHYHEIYQLNSSSKGQPPPEILKLREKMRAYFEQMRQKALQELGKYSAHGKYNKALNYFLQNYEGLTLFLDHPEVPIDNNSQERALRSHVVGRKTWYGTHSERGAFTAAVLFSLVETCKLNQINPREYFDSLVKALLAGKQPFTPKGFKSGIF